MLMQGKNCLVEIQIVRMAIETLNSVSQQTQGNWSIVCLER